MAQRFSTVRLFCVDYLRRHKKKVYSDKHLVSVGRLNQVRLEKLLAPRTVNESDLLCQHCYKYLQNEIASPHNVSTSDSSFRDSDEVLANVSQELCAASPSVTPLKPRKTIKKKRREAYLKKKQAQVSSSIRRKLSGVYGMKTGEDSCEHCAEWFDAFREALKACSSHQERKLLYTLLPPSISKKEILRLVPEATAYMIDQT